MCFSKSWLRLCLLVGYILFSCAVTAAERPPNFVLILADDLGYGDLSCYGSKAIATPRIDAMAKAGVRFTDFYVAAPFCSPSRAALLTGRLPARCGVPYVLFPAEHTGLPPSEVTIAEVLKQRGYATACIGKWHLGWDKPFRPTRQGFDEFLGLPYSNDSTEWPVGEPFMQVMGLQPLPLIDGERVVEAPVDQSTLTHRYTERAIDFIRRHREEPFFLYLPHTMPHIPQHASPDFTGKSKDGLYGDTVEELDASTGRILDALHELKLAENTLVIFTSDNGANVRPQNAAAQKKAQEGGRFPGRSFGGSNGLLRAGKGVTYEGGIRMPCIVQWSGHIQSNRVEQTPASIMDWLPTFAALAGAMPLKDRKLDGQDIRALLLEGKAPAVPRLFVHYFGGQLQAVREGDWKLFVPVEKRPEPMPPSLWFEHQPQVFERQHRLWPKATLYNLREDIGETKDVAAEHPEVVERLLKAAREFDQTFQKEQPGMQFIEGPKPPRPQQIRRAADDLSAWRTERQ